MEKLLSIYREAVKNIPALRYAWIPIGLTAAYGIVAIIAPKGYEIPVKPILILLALGFLGYVFSFMTRSGDKVVRVAFYILTYAIISTATILILSVPVYVFTGQPRLYGELFIGNGQSRKEFNDHEPIDSAKLSVVKVAVLTSGSNDYINDILDNFKKVLTESLPSHGYKFENSIIRYGQSPNYNRKEIRLEYLNFVDNLLSEKVDYYVSVGTPASKAFKEYFDSLGITDKKLIFLGVTDPVAEGLCKTLTRESDSDFSINLSGVAYCARFDELPVKIASLYPNKRLIYMYDSSIVQDQRLAKNFMELPGLIEQTGLTIKALNHMPIASDFQDPNAVYFSWETFEELMTKQWSVVSMVRHVVSTTAAQTKRGRVPFAISTDDKEIGQLGASILMQNLIEHRSLGKIEIEFPSWKKYVNKKLALEKGFDISIINSCDVIY